MAVAAASERNTPSKQGGQERQVLCLTVSLAALLLLQHRIQPQLCLLLAVTVVIVTADGQLWTWWKHCIPSREQQHSSRQATASREQEWGVAKAEVSQLLHSCAA